MKGSDIVKHISKELPKYTTRFTTQIPVVSITSNNGVATATMSTPHGLSTNDEVSITGAVTSLNITSITRQGNIVKVITESNHYLPYTDNTPNAINNRYKNFITIQGAVPNEYNGTWEIYTSLTETEFTFKVKITPATPATTNGVVLLKDYDNFNGYKKITVTNPISFTYPLVSNINSQVVGNIFLNITNVANSLSQINIERSHQTPNNFLYVVVSSGAYSDNDGVPTSDITATKETIEDYQMFYQKRLQLYAVLPYAQENQNILQGDLADEIHNVITPAIHKTLARFVVDSPFKDRKYAGFTLVSDELIEGLFDGSYSLYVWEFATKVKIRNDDVYSYTAEAPLREIFIDYENSLESKNIFENT